ncbi:MAG TPA: ABC transporter ATP-binding protein [Beijerinckiaceae bacterium]|nr:ABC transporter ATP-binding protein [Beijerinckiaceae bacterium]
MTALVEIEGVSRTYRMGTEEVRALIDVSLSISEGEFVAVMGPSGSGKSTFMNVIGCLDRPSAGLYRLAGETVTGLAPSALASVRNRRIGFVFQQFNLLQRADALANVELPMIYAGIAPAERHRRARAALERVGLGDRLHHRPLELSGGQQQRVAIARALVNDPKVLLADEPTGALDSRTSLDIMALFTELNRQGMTVIVVTHEEEIARYVRRLIRFRDGRVVADTVQQPADVAAALAAWRDAA